MAAILAVVKVSCAFLYVYEIRTFFTSPRPWRLILLFILPGAAGIIHKIQDGLQDDASEPLFDRLTCVNEPRFLEIIPGKAFRMIIPEEWIYKRRLRKV